MYYTNAHVNIFMKRSLPKLEVGMIPYHMIGDPLVQMKNLLRNAQYLIENHEVLIESIS